VLQIHYLKDKSQQSIAKEIGVNPYFVKDYEQAAYAATTTAKPWTSSAWLREYDLKEQRG
jgi:DNA polymerase-3 subunit delta